MPVVGVRELGRKVSKVIGTVERTGEPVIVTRHGKPTVAVLPLDAKRLEALTIAAAPKLAQDMARADEDLAAGRTKPLDEVLAELDAEDQTRP